MIRRSDFTASDANGTPEPGVYITVKKPDGSLADLRADDGSTLGNPFQSVAGGAFYYNAPAGIYTEEYRLSLSESPRTTIAINLNDLSVFVVDNYCVVNTAAGNTSGLQALAAAVVAAGGGIIQFTQSKEYTVGVQTVGPPQVAGRFTNYTGVPALLLELANCTKPVIVRGNGAKLKAASNLRYGTFDATGNATSHTPPFTGAEIATPYQYMVSVTGCSGAVIIQDLEFDGNIQNTVIGGSYGDTGIQIPATGLFLDGNTGGVEISGVKSHHHGLDGISINGAATSEAADSEHGSVTNCDFSYNGRLGVSFVGGRGWKFEQCKLNWNGNTSVTGSTVSSGPAAGVDLEAEGGKYVRDVHFKKCDFIGNQFQQIVAASGPTARVQFENCRLVATVLASNCAVPARPDMKFKSCLLAGTSVSLWRNPANPDENVYFEDCILSNSDEYSPTGTTACTNNLVVDNPTSTGIKFVRCRFDFNKAGTSINFSTDHPSLIDCTITARAGSPAVNGRYSGKTEFIETGAASIQNTPGGGVPGPFPFKGNAGYAEDRWAYTTGGVRTEYPANFSRQENKPIYFGSATYNPPSLAAGAKDTIQTMTVTGVALGDRVTEVSFSLDLAGARVVAWVSAANTVSYYAVNENGANPLDLASGTLRLKVVGA